MKEHINVQELCLFQGVVKILDCGSMQYAHSNLLSSDVAQGRMNWAPNETRTNS